MKISIITINLNNKDGLANTIQSVIGQSCDDYEYIVIDGASVDGSVEVINKYRDRIDYWVSEKDSGIYQAMNKGIKASSGDYLWFLNSGDSLVNEDVVGDCAERIAHRPGYDYYYGQITFGHESLAQFPSIL